MKNKTMITYKNLDNKIITNYPENIVNNLQVSLSKKMSKKVKNKIKKMTEGEILKGEKEGIRKGWISDFKK